MRDMNERMMKIAVGKIGKEAIKLVSIEYLNYMIEHPEFMKQFNGLCGTEQRKQQPFLTTIFHY